MRNGANCRAAIFSVAANVYGQSRPKWAHLQASFLGRVAAVRREADSFGPEQGSDHFCGFSTVSTSAFLRTCASCTGGKHFQVVAEGPPASVPKYVVVTTAPQIATLHFPSGVYRFYAKDDNGYYYRAPGPILEHVAGTPLPRKGWRLRSQPASAGR